MKRLTVWMMVLCFATIAAGETPQIKEKTPDPDTILNQAESAIQKITHVRYRADYKATGWVTKWVADVHGTALLGEQSEHGIERFQCDVKVIPPKSDDILAFKAGCDGDLFYLVDPKNKMVYEDMDPIVLGTNRRNIQRVLMRELVSKDPFEKERKAETKELQGVESVGGVDCFKLLLKESETQEAVWYFSKRDFLPRRVDRLYKNEEGELATTKLVLTNLDVNPKLGKNSFKVVVPDGYTKTNDFAP